MAGLRAQVRKQDRDVITLEIKREDFETFCAASGLYREDFLNLLDASDKDHRAGRVTKRQDLFELMKK